MMLPDEFTRRWQVLDYQVTGEFVSKRNQVYRIILNPGGGKELVVVVKRFACASRFRVESDMASRLHSAGAPVPEMLFAGCQTAVFEYIDGTPMVDALFNGARDLMIEALGDCLQSVYEALAHVEPGAVLGDMNLRNFILCGDTGNVFRVDFESVEPGCLSADFGKLCAFAMSYDPPYTAEKMDIARRLLRHLEGRFVTSGSIRDETLLELERIEERRGVLVPPSARSTVLKW